MNAFKLRRFHALVILQCVRWYSKYPISYRQLEEMMAERGVVVPGDTRVQVDENGLRHHQRLRGDADDLETPVHPGGARCHRRSAFRQQALRSGGLTLAAERARFWPTAVNATVPAKASSVGCS